jgi:catechol 2,3-dioxygenase-like lactoylglutathione lyase family enzyme
MAGRDSDAAATVDGVSFGAASGSRGTTCDLVAFGQGADILAFMIEHVSVPISDYKKSKEFYTAALRPLDYVLQRDFPSDAAGFCEGESTSFWIVAKKKKVQPIHVAMRASSKEAVQHFHAAALKAGGKDNGRPGFRREYGDDYYAAFVLDPDGNNIEACYFGETAPPE